MTPDQIEQVRLVIAKIEAHPDFAARFYGRLFQEAPQTADMFSDMGAQQRKLTDELAAMAALLADLPTLDQRAQVLGERHRGYGVKASHYRLARQAMLATLDELLGDDFTAEEREAWERATNLITELMQSS